ncbi:MAG: DUF2459 domain-containing protein [Acetobacteraceae bacterium]|nr:DUF2459 domain-containing protein [Acetobacteraceae bacterium]
MRRLALLPVLLLPACAATLPERDCGPAEGPVAWVTEREWHTEIGLTPERAPPAFRVPGAASVAFGFGKRDFMLTGGPLQWIAGPLPGPAVIQVTALRLDPAAAMPEGRTIRLPLTEAGAAGLARFIAGSFRPGPDGEAAPPIAWVRGSAFHDAARPYTLAYTCNSWTADALRAAGLPVRPEGVVLTGGVMRQAAAVPGACRAR